MTLMLQGLTDNLGNTYVLSKLMSSKFPLIVILAELAAQLRSRGMGLRLGWAPRDQNEEADALTNGEFGAFAASRRIMIDVETIRWKVLPQMLAVAGSIYDAAKTAHSPAPPGPWAPAAKKGKLRERDPW